MTDSHLPPPPGTSPDVPPAGGTSGEVRAKRRTYTAAEKSRILRAADRCAKGELGALLRREGIYSSHLTTWRRERDQGADEHAALDGGSQSLLDLRPVQPKDADVDGAARPADGLCAAGDFQLFKQPTDMGFHSVGRNVERSGNDFIGLP